PVGVIDADADGIPDAEDLCSATPVGAKVHVDGAWKGCSQGQTRDRDEGFTGGVVIRDRNDLDGDGIPNEEDLCSNTPKGATVHTTGDWKGCSSGQRLDDADRDGIIDTEDKCSGTPA